MPYKDKGHGGNYVIDLSVPGWRTGRFKKSSGVTSKKIAETYEADVRELIRSGAFDCLDAVADGKLTFPKLRELRPQGLPTVREHLEELNRVRTATEQSLEQLIPRFQERRRHEIGQKTLRIYLTHIRRYGVWVEKVLELGRPATIEHLSSALVRRWRDDLVSKALEREREKGTDEPALHRKRGRKRATANRHLNALGAFCTYLVDEDILRQNPVGGLRFTNENPSRESELRYMTPAEYQRLRAESLQYDLENPETEGEPRANTLFWDFLVSTGATTYSEGCWLLRRNVHIEEEHPHEMVRISLTGTKSQYRSRDVFVPRILARRLEKHAEFHGIALGDRLFPFDYDGYLAVFRIITDRLVANGHTRMARFSPYDLRHTFAVAAVKGDPKAGRAGVDLPTLQRLMGHNNIQTTMIYAKHRSELAQYGCWLAADRLGLTE